MNGFDYITEKIDYFVNGDIKKIDSKTNNKKNTTEFGKEEPTDLQGYDDAYAYNQTFNINKHENIKKVNDLIKEYRKVAEYSYVNDAIDEIVGDAVVIDDDEIVTVNFLDNNDLKDNIKKTITEEFEYLLSLLDFSNIGDEYFKDFYIDGRLYFQNVLNKSNPKKGIIDIKKMSPFNLKKCYDKDEKKYYWEYKEESNYIEKKLNIPEFLITYIHSGIFHKELKEPVSDLHFALRDINRLDILEDHLLIYRLCRAPQKLAWYIDTGKLPFTQSKKYIYELAQKYRNKVTYNKTTGKVEDNIDHWSMLEDIFLMRKENKNTEITEIGGNMNLGDLEDLKNFKDRVAKALKVPTNRLSNENMAAIDFSRQSEIQRDEMKFARFITKKRKKFNQLFYDILKKQLYLKGIMSFDEFDEYKPFITFNYKNNTFWEQTRQFEKIKSQFELLRDAEEYSGKYYSQQEIFRKILDKNENDVKEMYKDIDDWNKKYGKRFEEENDEENQENNQKIKF